MSSAGEESATLQSRLELADLADSDGAPPAQLPDAAPTITDPVAVLRHLDVSGRFHRDSRLGRAFHSGSVSLRENVPTDSLHVVVHGNRLKAHVDGVSPLAARSRGTGYSLRRAIAHNLAGMAQDVVWLLRGRLGDHLCELDCEWLANEPHGTHDDEELLDPSASTWSVQLEARVAGSLDEARLRAALGTALGRRDLERDPLEVVGCDDDDALDAARTRLQCMAVAVADDPPLHAYLARHPAGDVLMLNLNHAATDAVGALRVLQRIARAYGGDADPADAPLDFLAGRDLPVRPAAKSSPVLVRSYKKADERLRDVMAPPGQLAPEQAGDHPGYGFHLVSLSQDETRHAVDATRPGTSRNVLMAALHLAIGDWNLKHGVPARRIGVLVPANLRPADWRPDIVGNFSVTARISTSHGDRAGPASALEAVTAQTTRNKRNRTGIALIAALQRHGLLELWVKQSTMVLKPAVHNRLVDTALLCNLGFIDEAPSFGADAGDALGLWLSIPARSPMNLCIGAVTAAGRLHLTFRYPHSLFGPDAARRFAACYLDHIRLVADVSS